MALHHAWVKYNDVIVNPSLGTWQGGGDPPGGGALAWVHPKNNTKKTQGQSKGEGNYTNQCHPLWLLQAALEAHVGIDVWWARHARLHQLLEAVLHLSHVTHFDGDHLPLQVRVLLPSLNATYKLVSISLGNHLLTLYTTKTFACAVRVHIFI